MEKGYKVFNRDWTCRGFQFEVGKTYKENVVPKCCDRGFHYCEIAADCFKYYSFNAANKVAEIEAIGTIDKCEDDSKCSTDFIKIVREVTWGELLTLVNSGNCCTGLRNSGNWNSGDWNSGDWNSGDWNSGNRNSGNRNSGNWNSGDWNSGDWNSGNWNSGDWNSGDWNSGNRNSGDWNSGNRNSANRNSGDWNSGNRNSGNWNSGNRNSGNRNSGNWNSGNRNSGNRNSGDWNSGDWNSTDHSSGCFNSAEENIKFFDLDSKMTYRDWINSNWKRLLAKIPKNVVEWICESSMTDTEKEENVSYKTTGGYLKVLDESDCALIWWNDLKDKEKDIIRTIPNYNEKKFFKILGIKE